MKEMHFAPYQMPTSNINYISNGTNYLNMKGLLDINKYNVLN